jgi:uncharacterized protein YwgA
MLNFISNTLKTLPDKFWYVVGGFLGVSSITTPIAIAYLIVNSGSIQWKTGQTEVNLKGKQLVTTSQNDTEKLESQINELIKSNQELAEAAKAKNLDKKLEPEIAKVEEAAQASKVRLEDVTSSNKEVKDFVESAIAP